MNFQFVVGKKYKFKKLSEINRDADPVLTSSMMGVFSEGYGTVRRVLDTTVKIEEDNGCFYWGKHWFADENFKIDNRRVEEEEEVVSYTITSDFGTSSSGW